MSPSEGQSLSDQARTFALDLTGTVQAVVGDDCEAFRATAAVVRGRERFAVRQEPETGIRLAVEGVPSLVLRARLHCELDRESRYLTVAQSRFSVHAGTEAEGQPLLRFEYERRPRGRIAAAHIQVHGEHPGLEKAMSVSGEKTRRSRRRSTGERAPELSQLHLPVGGHRFRPCLEDVLSMLLEEFGVDHEDGAHEALDEGRERWRRMQVRAAVRDAPADAAQVLTHLGYTVTPPNGGHARDNVERLRSL